MSRVLQTILAAALALALAAGCGGGEEESASEQWVTDLCTAADDWRSSLEDTIGGLGSPAGLSAESIREAVDEGLDATEDFVDELRGLGRPETEAGQEAAAIVDSMAAALESTAGDLRATVDIDTDADSLDDLVGTLTEAGAEVAQLGEDLASSLDDLESLDGGEELRDAIESNEDCDAARSGS